ncbi:hypothetical protein DPX16_0061 [Anabarilius grahami]|uniref:Uncharacterized protein n=1 Tax=Anabarilius grahami TaxID=495550 RepID=A0A3N0YD94_ANAGA|nr:hypothetical protein DPX16_0061 [Anabarilius grahami]
MTGEEEDLFTRGRFISLKGEIEKCINNSLTIVIMQLQELRKTRVTDGEVPIRDLSLRGLKLKQLRRRRRSPLEEDGGVMVLLSDTYEENSVPAALDMDISADQLPITLTLRHIKYIVQFIEQLGDVEDVIEEVFE